MSGPAALVRSESVDGVGLITLDDPARRNALSGAMLRAAQDALAGFAAEKVRAVLLRSDPGTRVFSAGHDIRELHPGADPLGYEEALEEMLRAVRAYPGPVIAVVRGSVWGGAFDLVCSCDMVVADETASFAITPANLGLPYNTVGLLHLLGRVPLNLIREMFFTAAPVGAEQARDWHIVNHLVPAAELEGFAMDLARRIATKAPLAITVVKEQLRVLCDEHPIPAQAMQRIEALRRQAWQSADFREGVDAFLAKRPAVFRGE